ncbi:MAG: DUF2993 domain-containing protein [Phormidesmis sp.]
MSQEDLTEKADKKGGEKSDRKTNGNEKGSRIIGRVLPAAVRLWLRSQVEQVEDLSVALEGRDRDIISGYLPGVSVSAMRAVYKGIHIGELQLSAQDIRINVGQVVRGHPLRLMKVFPVIGKVALTAADLNASLNSTLLGEGLRDFWRSLAQTPALRTEIENRYGPLPLRSDVILHNPQICLGRQCLGLSFYPQADGQTALHPVVLATELGVTQGNQLQLTAPRWLKTLTDVENSSAGEPIAALQGFQWNLGPDTQLSQLVLKPERLLCSGQIMVNP